jgi:hypothetical protein
MIGLIILSFDLTYVSNYTFKNVCDINTERWMVYVMLRMFLRLGQQKKEIEMNNLCGYKILEK